MTHPHESDNNSSPIIIFIEFEVRIDDKVISPGLYFKVLTPLGKPELHEYKAQGNLAYPGDKVCDLPEGFMFQ